MRRYCCFFALVFWLFPGHGLQAAEARDLYGEWRWQAFTIKVWQCRGGAICAKVASGPKNVGMEIFASAIISKGNDLFGQVIDPKTNLIYRTRFRQVNQNKWRLDGCTSKRVCLTGEFLRVK